MAKQPAVLDPGVRQLVGERPNIAVRHLEVTGLDHVTQVAIDGAHCHAKSISEDPLRDVRASMHLVQDQQVKRSNGLLRTAFPQFQGRSRRFAKTITSTFTVRTPVRQENIGTQQKPVASQPHHQRARVCIEGPEAVRR